MMEPQEDYCYERKPNSKKACGCLNIIVSILFALFIGAIGLILGAVYSITLLANIAVLIAVAVILGILFILTFIYKICKCYKSRK